MKYTAEDLIKELYDTPEYNNFYSPEEFKEICLAPLVFFKKKMKENTLPSMRFKFLGLFTVYPGVIAKILHYNKERLDKGLITKETYDILNGEMEEVHRQLTTYTYKRGKVNIIYYDEELPKSTAAEQG